MTVTAIGLGVVIGLALGLLGGGGSILAVPIFVYVLHLDPKQAIAMSLAMVGVTSAVGMAGVGGGFLIVPALVLLALADGRGGRNVPGHHCDELRSGFLRVPRARAHRLAGDGPRHRRHRAGDCLWRCLHRFVPQHALRRIFSVFLVLVAAFILYRNLGTMLAAWSRSPS